MVAELGAFSANLANFRHTLPNLKKRELKHSLLELVKLEAASKAGSLRWLFLYDEGT